MLGASSPKRSDDNEVRSGPFADKVISLPHLEPGKHVGQDRSSWDTSTAEQGS